MKARRSTWAKGKALPTPPDPTTSVFVLRKDSVAVGYTGGHGQFLHWFG